MSKKTWKTIVLFPHSASDGISGKAYFKIAVLLASLLFPLNAADGISGKAYYKWVYPTGPEDDQYNEFSIDRIYLTYKKQLREGIKIKLTTDVAAPGSAWNVYQKYAYLEWETAVGDLFIGLQGMNVFNITESNWGYRFLAKSPMDEHHFASSADMGVGLARNLTDLIRMHLTLTNGGGYKHAEEDKYKKFAGQVVYGSKDLSTKPGFNAGVAVSIEPYQQESDSSAEMTSVVALFGAFSTKSLRIGGEFDREIDSGEDNPDRQILAVYADIHIGDLSGLNVKVFGRLESYDPDLDTEKDGELNIIAGVNVFPIKTFNIAPNIRYRLPEDGDSGLTAFQLNFEFKF